MPVDASEMKTIMCHKGLALLRAKRRDRKTHLILKLGISTLSPLAAAAVVTLILTDKIDKNGRHRSLRNNDLRMMFYLSMIHKIEALIFSANLFSCIYLFLFIEISLLNGIIQ